MAQALRVGCLSNKCKMMIFSGMAAATMHEVQPAYIFSSRKSCGINIERPRGYGAVSSLPSPVEHEDYCLKKEHILEIKGDVKRSPLAEYMVERGVDFYDTNSEGNKMYTWKGKRVTEQEFVDRCRERAARSIALIKEIHDDCIKCGIDLEKNLKEYIQYRKSGLEGYTLYDSDDADLEKPEKEKVEETGASSAGSFVDSICCNILRK